MNQLKTIAIVCMLYYALLHLAPKGFLRERQALILSDFRAQCQKKYQQRGPWGVLAFFWLTTLVPTVCDIGSEQLDMGKLFFSRLFSMKIRKKQFSTNVSHSIVITSCIINASKSFTINIKYRRCLLLTILLSLATIKVILIIIRRK